MFEPYGDEGLYIAGPECFYRHGYELWWSQRKLAEYYGIPVVLPTSTALKLDKEDLRLNAQEIFDDLIVQVGRTTAIIADLEFFRGCEPDGGTLFELGWIWARGGRLYGYSRDMRPMSVKNQGARLENGILLDQDGRPHPYGDLPFCPSLIGSTKLIEGAFPDALKVYLMDLDEERKRRARGYGQPISVRSVAYNGLRTVADVGFGPVVYFAGPERYSPDAEVFYRDAKTLCRKYGYAAVCPLDTVEGMPEPKTEDPYVMATWRFDKSMALLSASDVLVANLEDFHGWEPNSDVSFECGAAYAMGKRCIGYMPDTSVMRRRIPHYGGACDNRDWCGNVVENFDYPINLMFSCSMPIFEGNLEKVLQENL